MPATGSSAYLEAVVVSDDEKKTEIFTPNMTTLPPLGNWTASEEERVFIESLHVARNVIVPLLVGIGFVGNTLSLLVFNRGRFKQMSSSKYLAALSVTDNVFLLTLLLAWLHDFLPVLTTAGACKVVVFLSYTSSYLSVCFVICLTTERYVATCHPLHAQYILAKVSFRVVVGALVVSAIVVYSCSLWATTAGEYQQGVVCMPDLRYLHVMKVLTWTDTALTMVLPFLLLLTMNSCIAVAVCQFYSRRNQTILALRHAEAIYAAPNVPLQEHAVRRCHGKLSSTSHQSSYLSAYVRLPQTIFQNPTPTEHFSVGSGREGGSSCENIHDASRLVRHVEVDGCSSSAQSVTTFDGRSSHERCNVNGKDVNSCEEHRNTQMNTFRQGQRNCNASGNSNISNDDNNNKKNAATKSMSSPPHLYTQVGADVKYGRWGQATASGGEGVEGAATPAAQASSQDSRKRQIKHRSSRMGPAILNHLQLRTTRTLLLVSTTFLFLNLPSHALRLRQLLSVSGGRLTTLHEMLLQEVAQLLYYSTFALNFFLYTVYGRHFQQALQDLGTMIKRSLRSWCCL